MISHHHRCIFVHVPKCAGTSVEAALGHFDEYEGANRQDHRTVSFLQPVGIRELATRNGVWTFGRQCKWRLRQHENPRNNLWPGKRQWNQYYKFTIIRSPWGRLRSMYRNLLRDPEHPMLRGRPLPAGFDGFVSTWAGKGLMAPMEYWLVDRNGELPFDAVIEYEDLASGWAHVSRALGLPSADLPHLNEGASMVDERAVFSAETVRLVRRTYAWELDRFGYDRDPD